MLKWPKKTPPLLYVGKVVLLSVLPSCLALDLVSSVEFSKETLRMRLSESETDSNDFDRVLERYRARGKSETE